MEVDGYACALLHVGGGTVRQDRGSRRRRRSAPFGVINGLDHEQWHPGTEELIAADYDAGDLAPKAENKAALHHGTFSRLADCRQRDSLFADIDVGWWARLDWAAET